jgi:hypothetical protein
VRDQRFRTPVTLLALVLLLGTVAAHAGLKVDVLYDHKADFSVYRSYRWETGPEDDSPMASMVDGRIKATAKAELEKKGLHEVAPGEEPDLLLTYYGGIEDTLLLEGVRYELAPHVVWTGAAPLEATRDYQVGSLILDMVDAETEQVVWSGVAVARMATRSKLREQVEKAVRKVLKRFPPK